jgi:hypothetical protein
MATGIVLPSLSTRDLTANSPYIITFSIPIADTEYSFILPATVRGFSFRCRNGSKVKYGYVSGGDYRTLLPGCTYHTDIVLNRTASLTIYVSSSIPSILEIEYWTS